MKTKLRGLPLQLVMHLAHGDWTPKGTLTADMVWKHEEGHKIGSRYLPETVGRALRSLEEQSIIAVKPCGISVQYKWIPEAMRGRYIPSSQRPQGAEDKLFRQN
jgi:hypothetical protein